MRGPAAFLSSKDLQRGSSRIGAAVLLLFLSALIPSEGHSNDKAAGPADLRTTSSNHSRHGSRLAPVLVVGSVNVDLIMMVHRLPSKGETTISRNPRLGVAVGGKGANQAVAAARLSQGSSRKVQFICCFGNDTYATMLQQELVSNGVDVTGCKKVTDMPSGHGIVMLEADGAASSVVLAGANAAWQEGEGVSHIVKGAGVVLLQREVPEHVNLAVAAAAARAGVPVIQDVGGEDRPISDELLSLVDYLVPNESELQRITGLPTATEQQVIHAANELIRRGARNVIVTLAERGSILVSQAGTVLKQEGLPVPGGVVVDGTAAGDAFRAAFAVALVEGRPLQQCLQFAAAAGAIAVSRMGAVPSLPTRSEVLALLGGTWGDTSSDGTSGDSRSDGTFSDTGSDGTSSDTVDGTSSDLAGTCSDKPLDSCTSPKTRHISSIRGGSGSDGSGSSDGTGSSSGISSSSKHPCPYKFASRLNSMKARRDLVRHLASAISDNNVLGWIARQGEIRGLDLVDLNYPQHLEGVSTAQILEALAAVNLAAGAVCIRFPANQFQLGAFTNPDPKLWQAAVDLAIAGCQWAAELGASELVVWSPYDGYDYHFQVDYQTAWDRTVKAFQALADGCPSGVRVSLEFKPTDENTRFAIVPTTGAALLLANQVDRPNFGLTLDVGHLLMAGENPAQSLVMVAAAGKLFGVQLNDAHVKLGAEDGLAFGSVNPVMALEFVYWLRKVQYDGHIYFDTFPLNEDPVWEAEYNIRQFKRFWEQAGRLADRGIGGFADRHDAAGVLKILEADRLAQQQPASRYTEQ